MSKLIIYASQYGTTKQYAQKLSEQTEIPVSSYKDGRDLSAYKCIIHMGGLYAGGVMGLKNTIKALPKASKLVIVTVGLADVTDRQNIENIRMSISRQVPKELYDTVDIFHLRGGIDYSKLSFTHKTMMTLVYNKVKNIPENKRSSEDRSMIETFNKKVDFINYDSLKPIIDYVREN